ncbi:MAG: hypothetical protein J0H74_09250 [Chitinophagaceae bacterium]|nr:hypothetical protein [Chitinophagaceae bacterium]
MKNTYKYIFYLTPLLAMLGAGCKKEVSVAPEFANGYTRIIFIDAPGGGKVQFMLDGKLNGNGDSLLYNPDGTPFVPDPYLSTTTTVNYPSGGWTDNSPVNFPGAYGFYNRNGNQYSVFPNPTNQIDVAPIINGYNFYNWAALPAARHQLSVYSVINSTAFGNPISIRGDKFLDQSITLEGGALQTFFLLNKGVAKLYNTIDNGNTNSPLPIYGVSETINHFSNQMDVLVVKDHPDQLPKFKDSSAYIRFINVTPPYSDQSINQNTDSLDIYIAPIYGVGPDVYDAQFDQGYKVSDSIGREILVAKGLARFRSAEDAPFFEINVADVMRNGGKLYSRPAPGQSAFPRYYRVLAYRSGKSSANGDFPVAKGDWLALFNLYPGYNYDGGGPTGQNWVDSWLVRSNGTNFYPAISTILLSIDQNVYKGPDAVGSTHYLGFRSCVNYQKAGINDVFFSN